MVDQTRLRGAESMPIVRKCALGKSLVPSVTPPLAFSPSQIQVNVDSPRLTTVDAGDPKGFAFKFSGEINADPKRWQIVVDTLRSAEPNPQVEGNWNKVGTISIDGEESKPNVFKFSMDLFTPFVARPMASRR
jgi:hypothetical protein